MGMNPLPQQIRPKVSQTFRPASLGLESWRVGTGSKKPRNQLWTGERIQKKMKKTDMNWQKLLEGHQEYQESMNMVANLGHPRNNLLEQRKQFGSKNPRARRQFRMVGTFDPA